MIWGIMLVFSSQWKETCYEMVSSSRVAYWQLQKAVWLIVDWLISNHVDWKRLLTPSNNIATKLRPVALMTRQKLINDIICMLLLWYIFFDMMSIYKFIMLLLCSSTCIKLVRNLSESAKLFFYFIAFPFLFLRVS